MRHFYRLTEGVNVAPLQLALVQNPQLWNADTFRTKFPGTPHGDVDDILIRYSDTSQCDTSTRVMGDNSPIWHPAAAALPMIKPLALDLMRAVDGYSLGRVLISRLRSGGRILAHSDDEGEYVTTNNRARFHIMVQNQQGSIYYCGDEAVTMRTGEVWWFDAHAVHSVTNHSNEDRISLMVDVTQWV